MFLATLAFWSEPIRVDNELSNINSWREVHEKDEAALRPSIQGRTALFVERGVGQESRKGV
jgi:hypothetical protein